MDINILARLSGVHPQSVIEHKQVKGAHVLRIDLKNEPGLRRALDGELTGKEKLPDGDIFETSFLLDGVSRTFNAESLEKQRSHDFGDENGPIPAWLLAAEVMRPNAIFNGWAERISFTVFDRHSGAVYDLSEPLDNWQRPWMAHGLAYRAITGEVYFVWQQPASGFLEVNHDVDGEGSMHLAGAFSNVHFDMPNYQDIFEDAPDREFVIDLPSGFYAAKGLV